MVVIPEGCGGGGRGAPVSPGRPARGRVVAGAGLCLALVVGAGAGPALADPGTDPGGSGTASVGDTLRLAGLPGGGSFDPLRLDQIALRPGDDFADRTARQTVPFSVTDGTTKGSFSVEVAQPYSLNGRQVRVDQPPAVGITMGSDWPWPGVTITPYDQSQERLPLTGDYVDVFSRFSIANNTSRMLRLGSPGRSETYPLHPGSTTLWQNTTRIFGNGASRTCNDSGWCRKTNPDGM